MAIHTHSNSPISSDAVDLRECHPEVSSKRIKSKNGSCSGTSPAFANSPRQQQEDAYRSGGADLGYNLPADDFTRFWQDPGHLGRGAPVDPQRGREAVDPQRGRGAPVDPQRGRGAPVDPQRGRGGPPDRRPGQGNPPAAGDASGKPSAAQGTNLA